MASFLALYRIAYRGGADAARPGAGAADPERASPKGDGYGGLGSSRYSQHSRAKPAAWVVIPLQ